MEFKGTKGNWIIATNNVNVWADNTKVANCDNNSQASMYRIKNEEEMEANALLISKAPEMLEMLEKFYLMCSKNTYPLEEELKYMSKKAEQLIKEATEL